MIDQSRHIPLRTTPWEPKPVTATIEEITSEAVSHFDADWFWPAHPLDEGAKDGNASFYFGATGVIWALEYLRRIGATKEKFDFRAVMERLLDASTTQFQAFGNYSAHGSFLFGDLGTALLVMRLTPNPDIADLIHSRTFANSSLPIRELMWGMPSSMLACLPMAEMTGEDRWRALFSAQAGRLLGDRAETANGPLWTQDLYGKNLQYLGPVHGYAGNMIPLMRGWKWLTGNQRQCITDVIPRTLTANAVHSDCGTSWPPAAGDDKPGRLCQHCHGAPGMVTAFADAPFASSELDALLLKGGEFTWAAGPLAKGSNLCHGTGGNGYAFLKLFHRTKDSIWLERARAFAMTAIAQYHEAQDQFGLGRYSLWTGDIGLAVYLWDCLTAQPYFPTMDVF